MEAPWSLQPRLVLSTLWEMFPWNCFLQNSLLRAAVRLLLGDRTPDDAAEGRIQSGSSRVPVTLAQMAELQLWRIVRRLLLGFRHWCPLAWKGGSWMRPVVCPGSRRGVGRGILQPMLRLGGCSVRSAPCSWEGALLNWRLHCPKGAKKLRTSS